MVAVFCCQKPRSNPVNVIGTDSSLGAVLFFDTSFIKLP